MRLTHNLISLSDGRKSPSITYLDSNPTPFHQLFSPRSAQQKYAYTEEGCNQHDPLLGKCESEQQGGAEENMWKKANRRRGYPVGDQVGLLRRSQPDAE